MTQMGVEFRNTSVRTPVIIRNDHRLILPQNQRCLHLLLSPSSIIHSLMFIARSYLRKCVLRVHDVPVSCDLSVITTSRRLHHLIRPTIYSVRKLLIYLHKENKCEPTTRPNGIFYAALHRQRMSPS